MIKAIQNALGGLPHIGRNDVVIDASTGDAYYRDESGEIAQRTVPEPAEPVVVPPEILLAVYNNQNCYVYRNTSTWTVGGTVTRVSAGVYTLPFTATGLFPVCVCSLFGTNGGGWSVSTSTTYSAGSWTVTLRTHLNGVLTDLVETVHVHVLPSAQ